jgi:TRAP-type C4-dicarboxylate transport system substrate-binding protein
MTSVFRVLEPQIEEIFNEDNNAAWQTLTKNGIEIIELSQADADWFINLANEVGMEATVKKSKPENVTTIMKLLK